MPQVLMNFQHYNDWVVHFIEADCRSTIGRQTRYFHFTTLDELRSFVTRCHPDGASLEEFENDVRSWSRGSIYVNLSPEQYANLRQSTNTIAASKNTLGGDDRLGRQANRGR